jgi:hypothetical protein
MLQITDKLYLIMLYTSPWSRFEVTTSYHGSSIAMTKMIDTWVSALLKFMKISKTPSIAYQVFRHNSGLSWLWSYGNWIYNTIAYAISAYHHWCCDFESRSGRGVQHYESLKTWYAMLGVLLIFINLRRADTHVSIILVMAIELPWY